MYCRHCGAPLPGDSAFCNQCGKAQARKKSGFNPWLLLLLFLGPIGWLALAVIGLSYAFSDLKPRTGLFLLGFIFPPLWTPIVWTLRLPVWARVSMIVGIVAANTFWLHQLFRGWTVALVALVITVLLELYWFARPRSSTERAEERYLSGIRNDIDEDLDACHDLIAEIEARLPVLPTAGDRALQRLYGRALETRAEGAQLLRAAETEEDLLAAETHLARALKELEQVYDTLSSRVEDRENTMPR